MSENFLHRCRVCGLWQDEPAWGADGHCPLFVFCPCCGVESGYQDCTPQAPNRFRAEWIAHGAEWDEPMLKPENWSLEEQLSLRFTEYDKYTGWPAR